jgi:glycosyltransferase involved in cell wall biosynthesis
MKLDSLIPKWLRRRLWPVEALQFPDRDLETRGTLEWRKGPPCDVGLYDAGAAQIGRKLYVFGGFMSMESASDKVRVFDLEAGIWTESFSAPADVPQSHCAIATDGRRYIYLASGQLGAQCSPAVRHVFAFDAVSRQWRELPPLPEPRYAGTMQLWRGRLHFIGGARDDRWTPAADHWSIAVSDGTASEAGWSDMTPVPLAAMHRASIIHDDALFVLGGQQGDFIAIKGAADCRCTPRTRETYVAACFRLDAPGGNWMRIADMPLPASHCDFSILSHESRIVTIGGQTFKDPVTFRHRLTDVIQSYDTGTGRWSIAGQLPHSLKIPVVGAWRGTIHVITGQRGVGKSESPGPISPEVWKAPLEGLRPVEPVSSERPFEGRSILLMSHVLDLSGAPLLLVETARHLIEAGANVRMASAADDTAGWTIASRFGIPVVPIQTAAHHAAESDIVIANTAARDVMAWVRQALAEHPRIAPKLISWVHEIDVEHYMPDAAALTNAALAVFDSHASRKAWEAALRPMPSSVVIHPYAGQQFLDLHGAAELPFPTRPESRSAEFVRPASRQAIRARLGIEEGDFLVLCLASITRNKGQEMLLATLAALAERERLPIKLLLVGFAGEKSRASFVGGLNASQRKVLSAERCYVAQDEIAAFYRAADAFVTNTQGVNVSRGECFGRVTVEAMAMGVPTLGTAAGGTAEIIEDGVSGLLYPAGREGQAVLASKLAQLIRDPGRARELGAAGRARVLSAFGQSRFETEFDAALLEFMARL